MSQTLFEKIGGEPAMSAAVDVFYRIVLTDDRVSRFFEDIDMESQHAKQKSFLTMVCGGPSNYSGLDMREGHKNMVLNMGLNDSHFDAVVEDLGKALSELGVADELIGEVAAIAESVRSDVLNK